MLSLRFCWEKLPSKWGCVPAMLRHRRRIFNAPVVSSWWRWKHEKGNGKRKTRWEQLCTQEKTHTLTSTKPMRKIDWICQLHNPWSRMNRWMMQHACRPSGWKSEAKSMVRRTHTSVRKNDTFRIHDTNGDKITDPPVHHQFDNLFEWKERKIIKRK